MTNKIVCCDARLGVTHKDIGEYDYVFASPPEYDDIGLDPLTQQAEYMQLMRDVFSPLAPKSGLITVGLTDRKTKRRIIPKGKMFIDMFESMGYTLVSHKIWIKGLGLNFIRLNYSNILTFAKCPDTYKMNKFKDYDIDCWVVKRETVKGYDDHQPIEIPLRCINKFTNEGDTVLNPFIGSGTLAIAALMTNRKYIGFEISQDICNIAEQRIQEFTSKSSLDTLF